MIAIIVATPLQMFNATMIMRHHYPNAKADLFVLNIACDMHDIISKYQKLSFVNNVYYLEDVCHRLSRIGIIWDFLITTKKQKHILNSVKSVKYTNLLSTWVGKTNTWLFSKLKRTNPGLKLHFYEEGLGVYLKGLFDTVHSLKYMYYLLGYKYEGDYLQDLYLYNPDLAFNNEIIKMVSIGSAKEEDIKYIKPALEVDDILQYRTKGVYFENDFRNTEFEGVDEKQIIDLLYKSLGKDQLTVRMHPRNPKDKYQSQGYIIDQNNKNSWEDILVALDNLNDLALITLNSTAVFTPKMIYGKEPVIVILGKMIMNEYSYQPWARYFWDDKYSKFVQRIHESYNNKKKVIIPESFDEMVSLLKQL